MKRDFRSLFSKPSNPDSRLHLYRLLRFAILAGLSALSIALIIQPVRAQSTPIPDASPAAVESAPQPTAPARTFALPNPVPRSPVVAPGPSGQYVLEFSRSPVVGNRLRMESIYDEARLWFTRPRNWEPKSVKLQLRYRHSPALYASRSNLTVLINGTSIGSVPLNQPENKIGNVVFDVPTRLIQDYNEVTIAALQNNSPTCTQDPYDPSLWSEVLPDSKLVFDFQPQPITLDFSRYPYPMFDTLSLEANQLAYLLPTTLNEDWLTPAARLQTAFGRVAQYRSLDTSLVESLDQVQPNQRLVVIGTPTTQPALARLNLPLSIQNQRILDGNNRPLPEDVGVLLLTTTAENRVPVLVATGNSAAAVAKAVQFLVQTPDQQIGTGNIVLVNQINEIATPPVREWQGYLPTVDRFQLRDLRTYDDKPYDDISVRGSHAPALEFDFRTLPDDQLLPGSSMTLRYSYGPQVNPLTSLVEVRLDGIPLGGKRLNSVNGGRHEALQVDLPANSVKPNSKIQVNFRLDPRERRSCSRVTDQQLWGTIHADTQFDLKREHVVRLPDLKLLQSGYPFAAPQDLSSTAIVLPEQPKAADVDLLLEVSERLGRLSRAESVQLTVHRPSTLSEEQRQQQHLIAIGAQPNFPIPEAYQAQGFALQNLFSRQWQQSQVQAVPDVEGVVKAMLSPWNEERVLLVLTSQTDAGLKPVRDLISQDALFYQLENDTVLISANKADPSPYSAEDYTLAFLRQSPRREIATTGLADQVSRLMRNHWFFLAPGLIAASLLLYGITQFYLKQFTGQER